MWAVLRIEDWLLAGFAIVAGPLIASLDGSGGPFDPGRPVEGTLELIAVFGALVCLITGRSDGPSEDSPSLINRGVLGPLVGAVLLVGVAGAAGVGLADGAVAAVLVGGALALIAIRLRWPALPTIARRALVTPFILMAGSIFWSVIDTVAGGRDGSSQPSSPADLQAIAFVLGLLAAFSGVYYLMLIYAPRQIAEPEGGLRIWLARYAVFMVSVVVGVGWLRPFGV